jgi:plastin-1
LNLEQLIGKLSGKVIFLFRVFKGDSDEVLENNAKYAISIARKLGASIFLVWEDIKDVKSKMLMTFVGSLLEVYSHEQALKKEKMKILAAEGKSKAHLD